MTDLAWMKTYIGDEAALTGHLTAEEFGAYERLRRHYWQHGHLPEDDARLMRITSVEPDRWLAVAVAVVPLMSKTMPVLDRERADASEKRERKVAAGKKGAAKRWQNHDPANANANGKTITEPMAEPLPNQWPPAPAPDEVRYRGKVSAYARAREQDPAQKVSRRFSNEKDAAEWLAAVGAFPGDPAFDECVAKLLDGSATWDDVNRAAA